MRDTMAVMLYMSDFEMGACRGQCQIQKKLLSMLLALLSRQWQLCRFLQVIALHSYLSAVCSQARRVLKRMILGTSRHVAGAYWVCDSALQPVHQECSVAPRRRIRFCHKTPSSLLHLCILTRSWYLDTTGSKELRMGIVL